MIDPRLYYFTPYLQESYSYNDFRSRLFRLNEDAGTDYANFVIGSLERKYGKRFDPNGTTYTRDWESSLNNKWPIEYARRTRYNPRGNEIVGHGTPKTRDYLTDLKSNPDDFNRLRSEVQQIQPRRKKY